MDSAFMSSRAKRYHLLSILYRDEIPLDLIRSMQKDAFLNGLNQSVKGCEFMDLMRGAEKMTAYLKSKNSEALYHELRYDYADMFLNAGSNPVFPYESVHVTKKPVVMQKPVFELRKLFHKAGVHKSPEFKDLDEHIAVEMEFLRFLLEKYGLRSTI